MLLNDLEQHNGPIISVSKSTFDSLGPY